MSDSRFENETLLWPTLYLCLGFFLGVLAGGMFLSLPGALLGGALGPMVVYRVLNIRQELPRSRTIDAADHPTAQARVTAGPSAYTNAPVRRGG
ncbi:MAG: hypothetical protein ACRC33_08705 [Gemmataceae bacterium]